MDIIGDMLSRIRNGLMAKKKEVDVLYSKENMAILDILKQEGYIDSYLDSVLREGVKVIKVALKYYKKKPVVSEINRISKPSRRVYTSVEDMPLMFNGMGIYIISTSKGILSDQQARVHNVGGEIICSVF